VVFIPETDVEFRLPVFSTDEESAWYYISFQRSSGSNKVFQGNGANQDALQALKVATNKNQFWKFTGTWDNCKIVNFEGLELKLILSGDEPFYQLVASGLGDAHIFFWHETANEIGWRLINKTPVIPSNPLMNDNAGAAKVGVWREDSNGGNALVLDPVPLPFDFVIEATEEVSANDYTDIYGNIIFKSTVATTGQLKDIPEAGLTVNGVVKVEKTVVFNKNFPIGFPFAIAGVSDETYTLQSYNGTANLFETAATIEAGKGYLIQFPPSIPAVPTGIVTFTSTANPVLLNTSNASVAEGYQFVANPLVINLSHSINDAEALYLYDYTTEAFILHEGTAFTSKPFEALITVKGVSSLYDNIGAGILNGLENVDVNDPVVEVKYYTLQGCELQCLSGNGVYILKKIHASQKVETVKVFYKK
jgi:hypothetical protein